MWSQIHQWFVLWFLGKLVSAQTRRNYSCLRLDGEGFGFITTIKIQFYSGESKEISHALDLIHRCCFDFAFFFSQFPKVKC